MTRPLLRLPGPMVLAMACFAMAGAAHAQTAAVVPDAPSTATPNAITPPGGVARGVIQPRRPVDGNMVKHPPTSGQHKMPVIRPPGTAR